MEEVGTGVVSVGVSSPLDDENNNKDKKDGGSGNSPHTSHGHDQTHTDEEGETEEDEEREPIGRISSPVPVVEVTAESSPELGGGKRRLGITEDLNKLVLDSCVRKPPPGLTFSPPTPSGAHTYIRTLFAVSAVQCLFVYRYVHMYM